MHWLQSTAMRAGLNGASNLIILAASSNDEVWQIVGHELGLTGNELATKLAPELRLSVANLAAADAKALRLVPERVARRFNAFPLREDDRRLIVATSDPGNIDCEQAIEFASGRRVVFELSTPHQVAQAINLAYGGGKATVTIQETDEFADAVRGVEQLKPTQVSGQESEAAPVVRLTNLLIRDAIAQRASDIHIEPGEPLGVVRFRVDGMMRQHCDLPMAALTRVVSRLKVLARLDIADRLRPKEGRIRIQLDARTIDLRISTVPNRDAEKMVVRVLRSEGAAKLQDTGMEEAELTRLRYLLSHRDGIVFVTGPKDSGKTTTVYAALREMLTTGVNIMTVEDPIEYDLPGITQVQVDSKRGVTFASALTAILVQDPDIIFVGEIQDLETAQVAVKAAMGHLVIATLHTTHAISAISRLSELGLPRGDIATTVRGAVAQRLIRRLCPDCAKPVAGELTAEESNVAEAMGVAPKLRAVGCGNCAHTGYMGRVPIQEVAVFTPEIQAQVGQDVSIANLQRLVVVGGMRTLRAGALERVARGETTLEELDRVIGDLPPTPLAANEATVLVVDDDPVQRLYLTALLEKNGFRVVQAEDGSSAYRRLAAGEQCSLVLTDVHMQEMDGDELVRRVRADPRCNTLPMIVITGSGDTDLEAQLIDAGADDYIRKPIDPTRMLARVRGALRRSAA